MLIKKPDDIPASEITDPKVYLNRRRFMQAGALIATAAATGYVYNKLNFAPGRRTIAPPLENVIASTQASPQSGFRAADPVTSFKDITNYNNFYEFSTDKASVASAAQDYAPTNWKVAVGGLVHKPKTFDLDDLLKLSPPEERIYRMRCVEGWSMVIPWDGFSLSKVLDAVEPMDAAKYVAFTTVVDPDHMPNQSTDILPWPYVEGLRMDEAMHPLAILASGLYGRKLPPQDGAPIRLVTPWKYGFKGIKSIVKIDLVVGQPPTTWNTESSFEYGFYANVNPTVDHPRWSQATELRIGDLERRPTLMFNGYADQVASLYTGMDLRANF